MSADRVTLRFRPVGSEALLVEVDDVEAATALHRWIRGSDALPAARDVVPAARSVLLDGVDPAAWKELLQDRQITRGESATGRDVAVEVRYDGVDLDAVATGWGCSPEAVVERHTSTRFEVAFCGFAPGFAYCTAATDPLPAVARRPEPRPRVPAGAVALGGEFCGLYPNEMPGGWQLIGRTDAVLFDPMRARPALLQPGDRVSFQAVR